VLLRLIGLAGAAGCAAVRAGGGERRLLQVAFAHEPDEDAVGVVIPRDAGDYGDFALEFGGGRRGSVRRGR